MESQYQVIDFANWKRAAHYEFFRKAQNAFYGVSYNVDLTCFLQRVKENGLPFYHTMVYEVTTSANQLEAFRYRFKEGKVVLYEQISPSFRIMEKQTDLFKTVTVDYEENLSDFLLMAKEGEESQSDYFPAVERQDVFDISCIPWISFTHASHTQPADKDFAIPNFTWGKHFREGEKVLLPFSLQAHHSFVDGVDFGKFTEILQQRLDGRGGQDE